MASDWMTYSDGCDFARKAIGAEVEPEGDFGTSALLSRANDGLIAIRALRSEWMLEELGKTPEIRIFDQTDGALFLEMLYASYHLPSGEKSEKWQSCYLNHRAGDFKFQIENDQPPFRITLSVWGLQFSRADVESLFSPPREPAQADARRPTAAAEKQCYDWLRARFSDPKFATATKPDFRDQAMKEIGPRLSRRGFERSWALAAPDFDRATPGRRRKT